MRQIVDGEDSSMSAAVLVILGAIANTGQWQRWLGGVETPLVHAQVFFAGGRDTGADHD
jgi:hypothetical protein